jgi:hypothetical protein
MDAPSHLSLLSHPRPALLDSDRARLTALFAAALDHQRDFRPSIDALISRWLPLVRLASLHEPGALAGRVDELVAAAGGEAAEPLGLLAGSLARAKHHVAAARVARAARRALARACGPSSAGVARLAATLNGCYTASPWKSGRTGACRPRRTSSPGAS